MFGATGLPTVQGNPDWLSMSARFAACWSGIMGAPKIRETYVIGTQRTGRIEGVFITAVAHEGLTVTVNGKPGKLAILTEDGTVVAEGADVAREAQAVAVNLYRNFLIGEGRIRVISDPLGPKAP
jgi:hypothetical protein